MSTRLRARVSELEARLGVSHCTEEPEGPDGFELLSAAARDELPTTFRDAVLVVEIFDVIVRALPAVTPAQCTREDLRAAYDRAGGARVWTYLDLGTDAARPPRPGTLPAAWTDLEERLLDRRGELARERVRAFASVDWSGA